jgi:TRAP-type C4-dicarboxylate transport system permease small subunit
MRSGDLVNVDILVLALPPGARRVLEILVLLLCAGFCALLVRPALAAIGVMPARLSPDRPFE